MPEYLVTGRIFYWLDVQSHVTAATPGAAQEAWEDTAWHIEIAVDQLQFDTTRASSIQEVEPEDADLLCPHCGAGADVYDSSYCENCEGGNHVPPND